MKICYCEDEAAQAKLLKKQIEEWAEKNNITCQIDLYQSAEEFLFKAEAYSYNLLLLDIAMCKMNGMELARKIREKDPDVEIVFVTSDKSFVFDGYEVNALRYLVKPIDIKKLYEILNLVSENIKVEKRDYVIFRVEKENLRMARDDIAYIEAQGHFVQIHCVSGEGIALKDSFAHVLELLNANGGFLNSDGELLNADSGIFNADSGSLITDSGRFIPVHRSYAVNLKMVNQIGRTECVLTDGSRVPVSRNAYKKLNDAFIRFNMK